MDAGYNNAMPSEHQKDGDSTPPRPTSGLAIRRHTDRCFHAVEEVVPVGLAKNGAEKGVRGYIIDGVMIDVDDVAEVRLISDGLPAPGCIDPPAIDKG